MNFIFTFQHKLPLGNRHKHGERSEHAATQV